MLALFCVGWVSSTFNKYRKGKIYRTLCIRYEFHVISSPFLGRSTRINSNFPLHSSSLPSTQSHVYPLLYYDSLHINPAKSLKFDPGEIMILLSGEIMLSGSTLGTFSIIENIGKNSFFKFYLRGDTTGIKLFHFSNYKNPKILFCLVFSPELDSSSRIFFWLFPIQN